MRFSTIVSVVILVWGISPRQPSGKNIIRWLLKKRTNGSVRYCQYTSYSLNSRENICGIVKFVSVTNILVICHSKWSANLLI
ncbi:hypothetical protein SDY_2010 [Shigella dysenteriae Sd197]|uniref:Uncharacterized protein n=1 Tax=Shigella dysenteriae serotype 1 (strain Sd197) TaxID=300267 RepID=Q32F00_SHIDS|nr:hypothetical protein SDY_2010 [Shigella dysenteriae Sd197]